MSTGAARGSSKSPRWFSPVMGRQKRAQPSHVSPGKAAGVLSGVVVSGVDGVSGVVLGVVVLGGIVSVGVVAGGVAPAPVVPAAPGIEPGWAVRMLVSVAGSASAES